MSAQPGAQKPEAENIRYVQIQDPSSGWPTMVKTVREADVTKIDDCKDDIDTLLVFAGLYSAVLSAFIIESYKMLQQDNQEVMVGLMRQLVAQNFTSGPGFLNSTTPAPEFPAFAPPLWAIRVNVLWFISLILSLSAASFGMLVKQWLREYLALEYTTQQQRLRARQYRSPALSKWKVFEIAAFLPVLLQISLGLFFVGLCFFTSAIHSSVRSCTLPVVSAWAFFLLLTTVAPLFSPRCPFKTTFLKATLKAGRRYVAPTSRHSASFIAQSFHYVLYDASLGQKIYNFISIVYHTISAFLRGAFLLVQYSYGALRELWDLTLGGCWGTRSGFRYDPSSVREVLVEEEELVQTEQDDTDILMSIDALMSDDGLLPVMVDAVQQQTDPPSIVAFVLQIIGRRVGQDLPTKNLVRILEFSTLSKRAWSVTTDAIANTLRRHHPRPMDAASPPWVFDAVIILLSRSPYTLSQLAVGALRDIIAQEKSYCVELGKHLASGVTANNPFPGLSQQLLQLRKVPDGAVSPQPLMQIYTGLLCQDHSHYGLLRLLHAHDCEELRSTSAGITEDLFDLLVPIGSWRISGGLDVLMGDHELLHLILQYSNGFGRVDDAIRVCAVTMMTPNKTYRVMRSFAAVHSIVRAGERMEHPLLDAYSTSLADDRNRMINNITHMLQEICKDKLDGHTKFDELDIVRLCRLLLRLYFAAEYRNTDAWRALWAQCAKAIARYHKKAGWTAKQTRWSWFPDTPLSSPEELLRDDQDLTRECLTIIAFHPELYTPTDPHVKTPIPAELIAALWRFTTPEVKQQFDQLRQMFHLPTEVSGESDKEGEKGGSGKSDGERQDADCGEGRDGEGEGGEKNVDAESGERERRIAQADEHDRAALQDSIDVDIGASISQTLDTRADATRQETSDASHSGGAGIGEGLLYI